LTGQPVLSSIARARMMMVSRWSATKDAWTVVRTPLTVVIMPVCPVVVARISGRGPGSVRPVRVAFSRTERFAGTLVWRYQFEPGGTGTMVTESYEVTRPISRLGWFIIGRLYGLRDRRTDLRAGMQQTLQRIRETVEREDGPRHTSFHASTSQ
jgi:hypothetical protein